MNVSGGRRLLKVDRAAITVVAIAILATAVGCAQQPVTRDASEEANKALVRRWIEEGFNQHSVTVADELFGEGVSVNGQVVGREGVKQSMSRHLGAFPDLHVTIDDILAEGQKVAMWYTVEGTHHGEFEGIRPTGKHVKWAGFDLFNIESGKITNARFLSDFHGLLTQLGASTSLPGSQKRTQP